MLRRERLRQLGVAASEAFVYAMDSVCPGNPEGAFHVLLHRRTFRLALALARGHQAVGEALEAPPLISAYGATNPAEFFAVATETFFSRPVAVRDGAPRLYDVLRDFYRQDPAGRIAPES